MRKLIKKADPDVVEEWKWVKLAKGFALDIPVRCES
jgi:hypothetical protein